MFTKNRYIQNIINVIVFGICLGSIFFGTLISKHLKNTEQSMKEHIEQEWRQQAKRTLSNIQDQFMYDMNHQIVDPSSELSLQEWAKRNISGVLNGGPTGDMFMINLGNEKFIWDGSPDCAKPEFITDGRYMKDESEMHYDKDQANFILDKMRLAQSTLNTNDNYWWNFDGSPEYLEWVIIPPGVLGFNSEPSTIGGVKNKDYNKILIALGTEKDETENTFAKDFTIIETAINDLNIFVSLSVAICIFNLIIYVYLNKKAK